MQQQGNSMDASSTSPINLAGGNAGDMLARACALGPLLREHAQDNEKAGRLAPEVVQALDAAGMFGLFAPRSLGGAELMPSQAIPVIEELARNDGSSAWVVFAVCLCTGAAGAYLGQGAVDALFARGVPITAGQGIPNGRAFVEPGGYRVQGQWNYGSGVQHASHVHTGAIVYLPNGSPRLDEHGVPEVRIFYVPREQVQFAGNWDVVGLRATGSIDYSLPETFVPEESSYAARTTRPLRGGALYRMGTIGLGAAGHTAFALGVARRTLDELAAFARTKVGRPGMLGESESFLEGYAQSEASLRAARALVLQTWTEAEAALTIDEPLPTRQITQIRLALNHATWTAASVCDYAYRAAGGVSLRSGPLQRYWRDMHAGTQHVTSSPAILRECGRELLGTAEGKVWAFLGLVDRPRA
jgi:alkylation response protein AidB-like acyl-CoA dehydrogenase